MAAPEGYKTLGKIGISYKGDYNSNTAYERLDAVLHNGSTYLAIKDAPDGAPRDDKINWIYLAKGFSSDIGDSEITFTEAEARENINTGESVKTVFGKIKKFFADLTAPAFAQMITSKDDLLATKATGYVPDAKAVADAVTDVTSNLQTLHYRMLSFSNKQSGYYYYSEKAYGYGVLLVMDNSGILDFYSLQNVFNNATYGGLKILPTKSLGDKTSTAYVHYRDSTGYDLQIVFTDTYSHGTVIMGGAITNYSRSLWT